MLTRASSPPLSPSNAASGPSDGGGAYLEFNRFGSDYFLAKAWDRSAATGCSVPMSRAEREKAKSASLGKARGGDGSRPPLTGHFVCNRFSAAPGAVPWGRLCFLCPRRGNRGLAGGAPFLAASNGEATFGCALRDRHRLFRDLCHQEPASRRLPIMARICSAPRNCWSATASTEWEKRAHGPGAGRGARLQSYVLAACCGTMLRSCGPPWKKRGVAKPQLSEQQAADLFRLFLCGSIF